MTSDTHGPTFSILAGVLKRKRLSSGPQRQTPLKIIFNGVKGARGRHKNKYPVTLPECPFDWKEDAQ